MNVLDTLLSTGGGTIVNQLANKFGINTDQFGTAVSALVPAIAGAAKERIANGDTALTSALSSDKLTQFADNPASLASSAAADTGSTLLSQVFGSDGTNNIISTVAEKAGISSGIVTNMLPIVASFVGGIISRGVASGGNLSDTLTELANLGHGGILGTVKSLASKVLG